MGEKHIPMRQCLGCREMKPKQELLRVVRTADGSSVLDAKGKISGRGAYLCSGKCLEKAMKSRALERALGITVPQDVYEKMRAELEVQN